MDKKSIEYLLSITLIMVSLTILIMNIILVVYNAHYKEKFDKYWSGNDAVELRKSYDNIFDVCFKISSISTALGFVIAGIKYWLGFSIGTLSKSSSAGDIILFERPKNINLSMASTSLMTPIQSPNDRK